MNITRRPPQGLNAGARGGGRGDIHTITNAIEFKRFLIRLKAVVYTKN